MSDGCHSAPVVFSGYKEVDRSLYTPAAIAALSDAQWRVLNIWEFVQANLARYTRQAIAVHREIFSTNEPDEIFHELLVSTVDQVMKKHRAKIDAVGRDRSKILFTTMRVNCTQFMPRVMATKFNVRLERRMDAQDYDHIFDPSDGNDDGSGGAAVTAIPSYAACETDSHHGDGLDILHRRVIAENEDARHTGIQLTLIREHITGREMQIMTMTALDAANNDKIAARCKTTRAVIVITKHRLRKKLKKMAIEKGRSLRRGFKKELRSGKA